MHNVISCNNCKAELIFNIRVFYFFECNTLCAVRIPYNKETVNFICPDIFCNLCLFVHCQMYFIYD